MKPLKVKNDQLFLYFALMVVVVIIMEGTKKCNSGSNLPLLTNGDSTGDTIDVAVVYGPLSYYVYDDTLGGLNYDMLRIMESQTKMPLKLWPVVSLHDALRKLEKGSYDMLASLPSDNSIKKRFLTSESVFLDHLVLVQLSDSANGNKVNSALDLGPDTVFIPKDSPAMSRLANLSNEIGTAVPVKTMNDVSEEHLCMLVATGKIPLAVVNEKTARAMQKTYPRLSFDNPISFTQFQVWIISPSDTALHRKVEEWLLQFKASESYRGLLKSY